MDQVGGEMHLRMHVTLNDIYVAQMENKSFADFVTKSTKLLFTNLRLTQEFLQLPASQWAGNHDYQIAAAVARTDVVVNDHAERGAALSLQFSGSLIKNEGRLQFLLQVVAENRKRYPQFLKRTLFGATVATPTTDSSLDKVLIKA